MSPGLTQINLQLWASLNELFMNHSSAEFGRVCQILLALSFQHLGFRVRHFQHVGRPDFTAKRENEEYAVEVKAPPRHNEVHIKKEDLMGIENLGSKPVVAVLTYPAIDAQWLVVESHKLTPRVYAKIELKGHNMSPLSDELNNAFARMINKYREKALLGSSNLRDLLQKE